MLRDSHVVRVYMYEYVCMFEYNCARSALFDRDGFDTHLTAFCAAAGRAVKQKKENLCAVFK